MKIGFDNDLYLKMQSSHILERINQCDNKLYLELGGKPVSYTHLDVYKRQPVYGPGAGAFRGGDSQLCGKQRADFGRRLLDR